MPDFGLFLFDVVSDILNGVTFIKGGNPIWGWTVIGVIFLPMTVVFTGFAVHNLIGSFSWWKKLLILLLALILAPRSKIQDENHEERVLEMEAKEEVMEAGEEMEEVETSNIADG